MEFYPQIHHLQKSIMLLTCFVCVRIDIDDGVRVQVEPWNFAEDLKIQFQDIIKQRKQFGSVAIISHDRLTRLICIILYEYYNNDFI